MHLFRTTPRYLLLAGLAAVVGVLILVADIYLNQPQPPLYIGNMTVLSAPINSYDVHHWTIPGPGGK